MKTIIIVLAVLLIGCKKEEPIDKVTTTQQAVEPIEYKFAQSINSNTEARLTDMNGNQVGLVKSYMNSCLAADYILEDGVDYRLTMNGAAPSGNYTTLIWEGIVTSKDGVLTYSKTNGSGNMFDDNSCGIGIYVVK